MAQTKAQPQLQVVREGTTWRLARSRRPERPLTDWEREAVEASVTDVRMMVGDVARKNPWVARNRHDVEGYVFEALCWAVTKFDPEKGTSVRTYLSRRAAGAIIDYQRQQVGRSDGDRKPKGEPVQFDDWEASEIPAPADGSNAVAELVELMGRMVGASAADIIRRSALHGATNEDIAAVHGLSSSRVSQIRLDAVAHLRTALPRHIA